MLTRRRLSAAGSATATTEPGSYPATPVLSPSERHLVSRFSYGVTTALAREVLAAGGARAWFERQLHPFTIPDAEAQALAAWWPDLARGPEELWERHVRNIRVSWKVATDYQRWVLARRAGSNRQLLEVMAEFWENHLHVPALGESWFMWRASYGRMVRARALGRYADLLKGAITHPAMLIHLENALSTKEAPNENLGRELLELHTVGRVYSEDDVKDSARILTGWHVDIRNTWAPSYVTEDHATGPVRVLDFSRTNAEADGRAVTVDYLDYLARHPSTADRLARRLAVKFVRDDPPAGLVARLAQVYLDHDTAIVPVLRALIDSPEFAAARDAKVRTPAEDVVATYRVLGVRTGRPQSPDDTSGVNARLWQIYALGEAPLAWPRPDGPPLEDQTWCSPSRLLGSFRVHYQMSGGWVPQRNTTFRKPAEWLPLPTIRFDDLVDHLARSVLARPSTADLLDACVTASGCRPDETITAGHPIVRYQWPRLLTTLLDAPIGMYR